MTKQVFTLSIEDTAGHSFQYGFHLGTDEKLARQIAEEKFHGRVKFGIPVVTVALFQGAKMIDCFLGDRWQNEVPCDYDVDFSDNHA